jgi:dTDP-4-dehydrorhamnose 3,5-epimerase
MESSIEGVLITNLKQIYHEKGDIYHGLKKSELSFEDFGESYFSFINYNEIKAWKRHFKMVCNLVVPIGEVEFVLYDKRENSSSNGKVMRIILGVNNYSRLTIPPGIWYGFRGLSQEKNLLHNIASIEHDPNEQENVPLNTFNNLVW